MFNKTPEPRQQLAEIPDAVRNIFNNTRALRVLAEGIERPILIRAQNVGASGDHPWHPGEYSQNLMPHIDAGLPAARAALDALEASAEYKAAETLIVPILAAVAALEKREEEARQELQRKKQAHQDALAKANESALAKAASDPAVVAARKALEALAG